MSSEKELRFGELGILVISGEGFGGSEIQKFEDEKTKRGREEGWMMIDGWQILTVLY